jgi:LmbE family N-acetylglucosaminyl deacetylase
LLKSISIKVMVSSNSNYSKMKNNQNTLPFLNSKITPLNFLRGTVRLAQVFLISLVLVGTLSSCGEKKNVSTEQSTVVPVDISAKGKIIMAVFAHPDDEIYIGPLMAKYAREGAKVQLVTVTDGRYGTGQTDLQPGDELTALRYEEVNCAAEHIGIEKPIWMGYHDQLKLKDGFFGHVPYIQGIMRKLDSLVIDIDPDVIITWGPDGGSNHMDHRLVGASITQVYLSKSRIKPLSLYYVATPASHIKDEDERLLAGISDDYISTEITYSEEDRENTILAFQCYRTQYSEESMKRMAGRLRSGDQKIYLRPVLKAKTKKDNLFLVNGE